MKRHVVIGTAGHIDHGKTSLVRALTGTDTDRLAEEKRRGITIDLGFAHLDLPSGASASIVDVPGHEDFIRNMVAGATGIDVALLVVAADEGVMPQTREHLAILRMLDVPVAVVALTKADLVEPEWLELAGEDLRAHLHGSAYADARVVPVSAHTGAGVPDLLAAIEDAAARATRTRGISYFRMPIDRGFTVHGTGTVVTGTVRDGVIEPGAELQVLPALRPVRVRALQAHGRPVTRADAGMRVAAALVAVEKDAAGRGSWLVSAEWPLVSMLTARVSLLDDSAWELRQRQRVRLHIGTAEVMARVVLLDAERLGPGADGLAQLRLESPVVARYGDRFVLRSYSPVTTIGGGRVIEAIAPKRRTLDDQRRALLAAIEQDPAQSWPAAVDAAGLDGIQASELPIRFDIEHVPGDERVTRVGGVVLSPGRVDRAAASVAESVDAYHREHPLRPGMDRSDARRVLGDVTPEIADFVIERAIRTEQLHSVSGLLVRPGFVPTADARQAEARLRLAALYEAAGLAPPRLDELPQALLERPDLMDLIRLLERDGVLVPLPPDRFVHRRAIDAARARLGELRGKGALGPRDFRGVFDLPRKHLIPLLEHFDRLGWTRREGEGRRVVDHKGADIGNPVP